LGSTDAGGSEVGKGVIGMWENEKMETGKRGKKRKGDQA
jgi:hypothetical protein